MIGNPKESFVCVAGLKGAGKDEFCRHMVAAHGYQSVRFSDPIREEATRRYKDYTVQQLIEIGNEGRRMHGAGYWAEQLMLRAKSMGWQRLVINGIRNPGEIDAVGKSSSWPITLVGITAPSMVRFERISKRGQIEDLPDIAKFLVMDDADRGLDQPADGQQVDRCMALVPHDRLYNNAGTLEAYHAWIDGIHEDIEARRRAAKH